MSPQPNTNPSHDARPAPSSADWGVADLPRPHDALFLAGLIGMLGLYVLLIVSLLGALACFTSGKDLATALASEEIRYAFRLSMISCTLSALLSLWVAIPAGYLLSRFQFPGRGLIDALLDVPIVLPPLVIGLALLILF